MNVLKPSVGLPTGFQRPFEIPMRQRRGHEPGADAADAGPRRVQMSGEARLPRPAPAHRGWKKTASNICSMACRRAAGSLIWLNRSWISEGRFVGC